MTWISKVVTIAPDAINKILSSNGMAEPSRLIYLYYTRKKHHQTTTKRDQMRTIGHCKWEPFSFGARQHNAPW